MMTSSEPSPGDIWLTYLRFIDHPDIGKVRPIVVADVREDEVLALKVTSKSPRPSSGDLQLAHWPEEGLRAPSAVWLEPSFILKKNELLRDAPIGRLHPEDWGVIQTALRKLENRN